MRPDAFKEVPKGCTCWWQESRELCDEFSSYVKTWDNPKCGLHNPSLEVKIVKVSENHVTLEFPAGYEELVRDSIKNFSIGGMDVDEENI